MPSGVYVRTKENNIKISNALKGIKRGPQSLSHKAKLSKVRKGRTAWNKDLTKETDNRVKKYADKARGRKKETPSHRKGITLEEEYGLERAKEIRSKNHRLWTKKQRDEQSKRKKGKKLFTQITEKRRENHRAALVRNRKRGCYAIKPNKPETIIINLLKKYNLPYKYVGDGQFTVGYKNPDFVNVNGQKKVIEFNGLYWHLQQNKPKNWTKQQEEARMNKIYSKYGFKCLHIWGDEIKDLEEVKNKIIEYNMR